MFDFCVLLHVAHWLSIYSYIYICKANKEKCRILDWRTHVGVIEGIAQRLLYLHQYSKLRIIHKDLKPSNILLDINKNPKISDFGMARMFGRNELQANTRRVVGT
jgi:serine/threonine protein kinase